MHENFNRRDFIKAGGLGVMSLAFPGCMGVTGRLFGRGFSEKPNIIFIMADDHDSNAISCYGSKINKTPNIDRIAKGGMRFDNCFCTNSICEPSRATILTGKYGHINGVINNGIRFNGSQQTFPKLLQKVGYQTAVVGKWHLKTEPTGFDYWNVLPGQGVYYNPKFIEMGQEKKYTGYVTDIITDFALDFLKNRRDKSKPFCLMYQHKAPHRSWYPGPKHLNLYDDVEIPEPATLYDDYNSRSAAAREQTMTIAKHLTEHDLKLAKPRGLNDEQLRLWNAAYGPKNEAFVKAKLSDKELARWKYQRYIKDYLRCVASVDDNIGRLLDYLETSGLSENTLVVYTSDQGFFLGDHGWFDKRFMYEQSLRMPLLMRYPEKVKPVSVSDAMVLNLDFAPTFLELAGIIRPADMQGRSFLPILQGRTPRDWRTSMYYHFYEYPATHMAKRHYGVRTQRYKLIHFYYDIDAWELYDLQKDPNELNNVYENPSYKDVVKQLKDELRRLQKKCGDSAELADKILKEDLAKRRKRQRKGR